MPTLPVVRDVSAVEEPQIVYSFGSLVTDLVEYRAMVAAFDAKGFGADDCEFLYVDNTSGNRLDAFEAYNRFLLAARGRFVILCHQDILPLQDDRTTLDARLAELTRHDAHWGLCGNAGATANGKLVYRLTHGRGEVLEQGGPFPTKVVSLDENFIVARRDANLALSRDLEGFHWYGSDLCIVADILGWNAYVIDFHLAHKSKGTLGADFRKKASALRDKYARAFRSRWQHVPMSHPVFLSSSPVRALGARAAHFLRRRLRSMF